MALPLLVDSELDLMQNKTNAIHIHDELERAQSGDAAAVVMR